MPFLDFAESPLGSALALAQLAFTIWMAIDAYQRASEFFWVWIIILFQPLGAWIYFFAVKLRSLRIPRFSGGDGAPRWQRKLSLKELRYRAERSPTVVNRLALAERLMDSGAHDEALPLLEAVVAAEPNYGQAQHALALCQLGRGEPAQAVPVLRRLLERDRRWSNYRAWHTLIEALDALHQPEEALQAARELTKMMPTLENRCRLAERLIDTKRRPEAIALLEQALEDHSYAPLGARWRNWRWARTAQKLLREAEAASPPG